MTPIALRAPETILKQPVDEKIDIWSFGCLVYEIITGTQLFAVTLCGDDDPDEADDEHLVELNDVLGDLPPKMVALWPRAHLWFGPNKERLNPNVPLSLAASTGAVEPSSWISEPLEAQFRKNKPDDIGSEESVIITTLIRRILRYNPSERPTADELLQEEWFKE